MVILRRLGPLLLWIAAAAAFAKDIPLPPPATVPSVLREAAPSVASDGRDYLAVWVGDYGVRGARISGAGEVIDRQDFVISDQKLIAGTAVVTWTGSSYLIVYGQWYARVSSNGDVIVRDEKLPMATQFLVVPTAITWNGRNLLLTWQEPQGRVSKPLATLLDGNLQIIRDRIEIGPFATVATADGFIAFTTSSTGISATTFANDGTFGSENVVSANVRSATAASDGRNIVLAWRDTAVHTMNFATRTTNDVSAAQGNPILTGGPNGFLLSWVDAGIVGTRLDDAGKPIDATPFTITRAPYLGGVRGASNGDSYFLIWSDGRRTPFFLADDVWGAHIPASRPEATREMPIVFSAANQFAPAAAVNASMGLVAWSETASEYASRVVAARFSRDGTFLDPAGIEIAAAGSTPSVATDGRDFVVVWRDRDQRVRATLVRADGSLGAVQTLSTEAPTSAPQVIFDGENYFAVWTNDADYEHRSMRGARLNRDGLLIDSVEFNVGAGVTPAIGFNGTDIWLVYLHPTISNMTVLLAQRLTRQGFLAGSPILLETNPVAPNPPAISCGNGKCLAAWNRYSSADSSDLYGAILGSNGIDVSPFPISTAYQEFPPSIAFDGAAFIVTWADWANTMSIREARVSPLGQRLGVFTVTSGVGFLSAAPVSLGGAAVIYGSPGPISRLFLRLPVEETRRRAAGTN